MENAYVAPSRVREAAELACRTCYADDTALHPDAPAIYALTDFEREYPITVRAERAMNDALSDMNRLGVHALLVTHLAPGGEEEQVLGLVTASEIRRAPPGRALPGRGSVDAVMTRWDDLSLVNYASLQALCALELYERFAGTGLTHLLVVDYAMDGCCLARGLVSRASLARRLRRGSRRQVLIRAASCAH